MLQRRIAVLVTALLFIATGNFTTAAAENLSKAEARLTAAAAILADIKQATWIRDGQSAHVIYVFFDPNCPACHKLYETLRTQVERGEVELRWIPTDKLMTTSTGKAATLIEAKDPTEAFHKNERNFSRESGSFGGIDEEPAPRADTLRRLNANHALLTRAGFNAVPTLVFRTRDGQADFIRGAPPAAFLEQLLKELE